MVLNIISRKLTQILLILCLIPLLVSFNPSQNCKKYFSGKWKYDKLDPVKIYVVRTKKKQFEYIQNGKYYYEYDLKWLDKCRYQLTYVGTNSPKAAIIKVGESFIVEILDADSKKMTYKTSFLNKTDVGIMTKID